MKSLYNFIITPLNKRYDNELRIGNKKLIVNTSIEEFEFISRLAKVLAVPTAYETEIKIGDTIIVHHNIFRRWYDNQGEARNSASYFTEEMYFAAPDQIYLYKHDTKWQTFGGYCFIKPIKHKEDSLNSNDTDLIGVVKYNDTYLEDKGIKEGDLVGFPPKREWRFLIDEELLYCMKSNNIFAKYEYKGNEVEYNPSWAQSSRRINKSC